MTLMGEQIVKHGSEEALPPFQRVLAVCAHPDDESFGLGAVLDLLSENGAICDVLCFTHGEASTLGGNVEDLGTTRAGELAAAARVLGVRRTHLLDYPDGGLATIELSELVTHVRLERHEGSHQALLVFDEGGITGHPDHCRATEAALVAAELDDLDVIAWAIPLAVAQELNACFGAHFVGRITDELDLTLVVKRARQMNAIACHASQSQGNPVLWRRLELLENAEHLRFLRRAIKLPAPPSPSER